LRDGLARKGPLRSYLFGTRLSSLPEGDDWLAGYKPGERQTALADSLAELFQRTEGEPPAAIVVATDGRDNASKSLLDDVARECGKRGAPLHIYGVGSSEAGNLQLREMIAPETLFPEDTAAVPVRWRCQGLKQGTVQLILTLNGKEVSRKEVPVREGMNLEETLTFTPTKQETAERGRLAVTLRLKESEVYHDEIARPVR